MIPIVDVKEVYFGKKKKYIKQRDHYRPLFKLHVNITNIFCNSVLRLLAHHTATFCIPNVTSYQRMFFFPIILNTKNFVRISSTPPVNVFTTIKMFLKVTSTDKINIVLEKNIQLFKKKFVGVFLQGKDINVLYLNNLNALWSRVFHGKLFKHQANRP